MTFPVIKGLAAASMLALLAGAPALSQAQTTTQSDTTKQPGSAGSMGKTTSGMSGSTDGRLYQTRRDAINNSDCLKDLTEYERDYPASAVGPRVNYRTLYEAAQIFAMHGQEDACENVANGIRELREEVGGHADRGEVADVNEARLRRMETAVPTSELAGGVRASEVIGLSIENMQGETLGDVEDVILDPTKASIQYVLVGTGGFLGLGEDWVAVPWKSLRVTPDLDDAYLPMSEEAFENAPRVNQDSLDRESNSDWSREVEDYYSKHTEN